MHRYYRLIIILGIVAKYSNGFWPPAYKIDLSDRKTFVISSDDDDYDDEEEDEMIKPEDLANLVDMKSFAEEEEKYKPLHSHVEHYNKREIEALTASSDFLPYFPDNVEYDGNLVDDEKPFIAGFKEDLDKYDFAHGENENLERKKRNASGIALKIITSDNHLSRIKRSNEKSKRDDDDYVSSEHPDIEFMEKMSGRNTTGLEFEEEANTGMLTILSEYSESVTRETTELIKEKSTVRTTGIPITEYSSSQGTTKLNGETNVKQTTKMSSSKYSLTVAVKNELTTGRPSVAKGPVEGTTGSEDGSSVVDYFEKTQAQTVMSKLSTTENSKDDLEKPDDITSEKGITSTNYKFLETTKESSRVSDENIDNLWVSQKETTPHDEESYKDEQLELEYNQQIKDDMNSNKTYNYKETGEPEETAGDALKKIVELKKPKNCTKEELTQFGFKAMECLASDYQHAKNKTDVKKVLTRTWIIIRIWIFIYVCIAIPLWCQKGWCCCCFRCKFCFPRERIQSAKEYYAKNPPGILQEAPVKGTIGETTKYTPTLFELEAYERFEEGIRNL